MRIFSLSSSGDESCFDSHFFTPMLLNRISDFKHKTIYGRSLYRDDRPQQRHLAAIVLN
jgi:hypothetical protein